MHLFIESSGAKLSVRDGLFEVHFVDDQKRMQKAQHAPREVRSIWLNTASSVTVAALALAVRHDVDVVFCDGLGRPVGRFMPHTPSSTSLTQKAQVIISQQPEAVDWVKRWVIGKIEHREDFLRELSARRGAAKAQIALQAVESMLGYRNQIAALEGRHVKDIAPTLRGLEGTAGRVYFAALSALVPVRYRFEGRSYRPAKDAFNAFLNYGYAILYSKVEIALTRAGLNPWLGFLHRDGYRSRTLVYDFIEPYRVHVERPVFHLFSEKAVSAERHQVNVESQNGVLLNTEGKRLLVPALHKHLAEKGSPYRTGKYTPEYLLKLHAEQFAARLRDAVGAEALTDDEAESLSLSAA